MPDSKKELSLNEAASRFLATLPLGEVAIGRQVIYQFVRWFGRQRHINNIAANEVAKYAQKIPPSVVEYKKRLDLVKAFLAYARKEGWIKKNLAIHIKIKKEKPRLKESAGRKAVTAVSLTREGYDSMKKELSQLRSERPRIVEEMKRAAEDKDFKENAPLDAARERLGYLEGRIMELEETFKSATVITDKTAGMHKVCIGDRVVLIDLSCGEELKYTIVSPREVNPAEGKISNASPIGRTAIGRCAGDVIEIEVPAGRLSYRVERVERG
jgi:transcription elongation factor GreA